MVVDETVRVEDLADPTRPDYHPLDPTIFPNADALVSDNALGRLQVSNIPSERDPDGDGDTDALYAFGGRSFSILDQHGHLVFDSGDQLEQIAASRSTVIFNADQADNEPDTRSDNRGPQPEGIALGKLDGHTYAFIGLHTQGGIVAYDVTDPHEARFVDYINTRTTDVVGGDLATKGISFLGPESGHPGSALIAAAFSESGTVRIFRIHAGGRSPSGSHGRHRIGACLN